MLYYFNENIKLARGTWFWGWDCVLWCTATTDLFVYLKLGEKQAATHISLDQEYDSDFSQQWKELEEQVVTAANKGTTLPNFQPTQYCLNKYSDNSRFPLGVVEGKMAYTFS